MEGGHASQFFLEPKETLHRRYEALRAVFVAGEPIARVAERFGYKLSALRSMASRFRVAWRRGVAPPFSSPTVAGDPPGAATRRAVRPANRRRSPTVAN